MLLVSDENCRVAAKVEGTPRAGDRLRRTGDRSVTPLLDLNFLSKQANLQTGAKSLHFGRRRRVPLRTAGRHGERFQVRELDGQAQMTPAVDLSHLEDVFVVTGKRK